jgi:four helix bundle protein
METVKNNSYRDLRVWQDSIKLAKIVYLQTSRFPKDELYGLSSQVKRSTVSIASNIAEGCARNNNKEFIHFLGIASGSLAEAITQMTIALEIGIIMQSDYDEFIDAANAVGKMLSGLKKSLFTNN